MAVTIKDIAKLAGVSPSTVSRVCNGNPAISAETRQRVQEAMERLGYQAAEVSHDHSVQSIGIILPPIDREAYDNPFFLKAIRGISQVCNQRHVLCSIITGEDYQEILEATRLLHTGGKADGFVMLYSRKEDTVTEYLRQNNVLYVTVGKDLEPEGSTISIDNDNLLAGREATDYLCSLGHRRIGYLGNRNDFLFAADRRSGYQLSHLLHNLPIVESYSVEMQSVSEESVAGLTALLRREDRPTAFVVSDDMLVSALERTCARLGLKVPEDGVHDRLRQFPVCPPAVPPADLRGYQLLPPGPGGRHPADQPPGNPRPAGRQGHRAPPHRGGGYLQKTGSMIHPGQPAGCPVFCGNPWQNIHLHPFSGWKKCSF